jgi:hypothetical protein
MVEASVPTLGPVGPPIRAGRRFVALWTCGLLVLGSAVGTWAVARNRQFRNEAIARHRARIDPQSPEPGRTEPERTPPPGVELGEPRVVQVGVYVDRIFDMSIHDANWSADLFVWFHWTGLDLEPGETFQVVDGTIVAREKLTELDRDGAHYTLYRITAKITKFFDVRRFPADDHLLTIDLEDTRLQSYQLRYVADAAGSSVSSRVRVPGYRVLRWGMAIKPHGYRTSRGDPRLPSAYRATYSQCVFGIWIARAGLGYYVKLVQGLYAALACALVALFIKPTDVDPRFGLGVGALFAAIGNTYITSTLLPNTEEVTMMDTINGIAMGTIFLTLVQSTISLYLYDRRAAVALSRLFDRASFLVLLPIVLAINILVPLSAML